MNTCSTCKFYTPSTDAYVQPLGTCSRWHEGYGINPKRIALNEVIVENDEGWAAYMGPEFGCVLWEAKP